jgi:hypothetical protein
MEACAVNWLSHSSGENSPLVHTLVVWGLPFGSECTISYTMLNLVKTPPASFRDIRPDLRERLRSTSAELDQLQAITENLEKTIQVLEQMLAEEERRFAPEAKKGPPEEPLPEFVMQSLRSGLRSKDDLRWMAEQAGYDVDGRNIHATLVNLIKSGRAVEVSEGQYGART